MNFYSHDLDYNFINSTIQKEYLNEINPSSIYRNSNENKLSKKLYQEAKNVYKNKLPKYASR